ncbi:hypothetical protein OBBRIDRAFT_408699 [Obba rivulosa]|uniref:Uncharacterized protein n=1 Tax=Obba rivulosa TaxID=1052685 RepID=A0A8E2AH88_9APHY|nr:hypothetical protein OBBRIDRAFT_408699 [Obba rivulosa]
MKKAFNECYKAVLNCEDDTGRRRCELFKELPDRRVSFTTFYVSLRNLISLLRNTPTTTSSSSSQSRFPSFASA